MKNKNLLTEADNRSMVIREEVGGGGTEWAKEVDCMVIDGNWTLLVSAMSYTQMSNCNVAYQKLT